MVLVNVLSVIMMECTISCREERYLVNRIGIYLSMLYRPNSWKIHNTALNILYAYVFIHEITIMIKKKLLCVIQLQFFYMSISTLYIIQTIIGTQCNRQSARHKYAARICTFHGENDFNT